MNKKASSSTPDPQPPVQKYSTPDPGKNALYALFSRQKEKGMFIPSLLLKHFDPHFWPGTAVPYHYHPMMLLIMSSGLW